MTKLKICHQDGNRSEVDLDVHDRLASAAKGVLDYLHDPKRLRKHHNRAHALAKGEACILCMDAYAMGINTSKCPCHFLRSALKEV